MKFNENLYIGKIYNGIEVLKFDHFKPYKRSRAPYFLCKCHCGNEKIISLWSIKSGITKSCGCITTDKAIANKSGLKHLYGIYKRAAHNRNYSFNISLELFEEVTSSKCFYCGMEPNIYCKSFSEHSKYLYNGIDRIDNTKGYELNNIVPCCKQCNRAKMDLTLEEFKEWINRLVKNLKS